MQTDSKKHENPTDANNVLADGALSWWNSMTFEEQFYKTIAWLKDKNRNVTERHPHKLSIDEIVEVYQVDSRNSYSKCGWAFFKFFSNGNFN